MSVPTWEQRRAYIARMRDIVGDTVDPFGAAWDRCGEPQRRFLLAMAGRGTPAYLSNRAWLEISQQRRVQIKQAAKHWAAWFSAVVPEAFDKGLIA